MLDSGLTTEIGAHHVFIPLVVWSVYEQTCIAALDCGDHSLAKVHLHNNYACY